MCVQAHMREQVCVWICVYTHASVHMHLTADAHWGQRHWILLELELQVAVSCPTWVLGIACPYSARAICTLIPESSLQLYKMKISLSFFLMYEKFHFVLLSGAFPNFPRTHSCLTALLGCPLPSARHYTETKGLRWAVDQLWLDVLMALMTPISFVVCREVVKVQDILAICNQV